jgi:hypothetical protein
MAARFLGLRVLISPGGGRGDGLMLSFVSVMCCQLEVFALG